MSLVDEGDVAVGHGPAAVAAARAAPAGAPALPGDLAELLAVLLGGLGGVTFSRIRQGKKRKGRHGHASRVLLRIGRPGFVFPK